MERQLNAIDQARLSKIRRLSSASWSLDDWALKHYELYGENDRAKSPMEIWLQVVTEGARLAESVRRGRIIKALDNIVGLFGWLSSFVGKYLHERR